MMAVEPLWEVCPGSNRGLDQDACRDCHMPVGWYYCKQWTRHGMKQRVMVCQPHFRQDIEGMIAAGTLNKENDQ